MSWFKKGNEIVKALEEVELKNQLVREKSAPRFWLKPGEEASVVFVDDEGFWCERHIVKLTNGKIQEITCKAGISPCSLCLLGYRIVHLTYFTVIDLRQYVRKDGSVVKYSKVLLPAKRTLAKQIFDFKQKFGSLVGAKAILKRYSASDPSCGIIIDFARDSQGKLKRYNIAALGSDYAVPFDYIKILAPLSDEELKVFGIAVNTVGSIPDVPFDDEGIPEVKEDEPTKQNKSEEGLPEIKEEEPVKQNKSEEGIPEVNFEEDDDIEIDFDELAKEYEK